MATLFEQHRYNTAPGPLHEGRDALPTQPPKDPPVRYIAYYLPQFHPIAENDAWHGVGFTEWTNVTKALPRYVGHYQPRLPADLGFYNLTAADTLRRQAELARLGGVHGFCIHNYWFNGRRVLETPLQILLANTDIDLPFCLNWANESWSRRWDGSNNEVLLEQRHSPQDDVAYIDSILPAVEDQRYIRVEGRPLIMIYRPGALPDARATIDRWREHLGRKGFGDPYIVTVQAFDHDDPREFGADAVAGFPPHNAGWNGPEVRRRLKLLDRRFSGRVTAYDTLAANAIANQPGAFRLLPGVCPQWDNEARWPGRGISFYGATPTTYGAWLRAASRYALQAPARDERIVFINAWNEWAEGAYLEPDRHYGFAYLAETARALASLQTPSAAPPTHTRTAQSDPNRAFQTKEQALNVFANRVLEKLYRAK